MVAIIIFIIILGVLIFVHELGHFLTAKRNGVKSDEFGFGFPPRMAGFFQDEKTKKYKFVWGNKDIETENTIYSINWIPLGGFVKIKGADTLDTGKDSFASKKAWPRIKILAAGVVMNFVLAWILLSLSLMIGAPEMIGSGDQNASKAKIQIDSVVSGSPAEGAGIKIGDEIIKENIQTQFTTVEDVQKFIRENKGKEIELSLKRGDAVLKMKVVPRENAPEGEGALGISMAQTNIVAYPFFEALWLGAMEVYQITIAILLALGGIIASLFAGRGVGADVSGPIGIAMLTKQVATLGATYVLRFAALLSINLGIINALPIPALDGGRILFILIEKIKGSPVSQETEQKFHTIGFILLILLMVLVTLRDVVKIIK
jgi:regulator of sigma E protease